MSSSQQGSSNTNTNPTQPSPNHQYDDYMDDVSIAQYTSNRNVDQSHANNPHFDNPSAQVNLTEDCYQGDDSDEDYLPSDVADELNANIERMVDAELNDNEEDLDVFSDDVQNAFDNYENEYSRLWKQNQTTLDNSPDEEQDDIFNQMRECMQFMAQEYSTAEMPNHLVEQLDVTKLNPDAAEFQPSWSQPTTSTVNQSYSVQSWETFEVIKDTEKF